MNESTRQSGCVWTQNGLYDGEGNQGSYDLSEKTYRKIDKNATDGSLLRVALLALVILGGLGGLGGCNLTNAEIQPESQGDRPSESPISSPTSTVESDDRALSSPDLAPASIPDPATVSIGSGPDQGEIGTTEKRESTAAVGVNTTNERGDRNAMSFNENPEVVVVDDSAVALAEIVNQLGPVCDPLTEATYESHHLQFPDTGTTGYVRGTLRKVVDSNSPLRQGDTPEYCYPDQRVTPEHALIIQREGSSILIDMEADSYGYVLTTPVSFSADGRYLIAAVEVAYTGGDPGAYSIIFDLDRREKLELESYICKDSDFDEYLGFTQPSEMAFRCSNYGGLDPWTEVLDLETRSISKLSIDTDDTESLDNYGTIVQPFQYSIFR